MSNAAVTQRILNAVDSARSRAKSAERDFDYANNAIQRKASYSINLFGGTATSQVADIARDARRACDDLYTSYQSLIVTLDETCRPLLSQDPSVTAVKAVADMIKWLNDESEIESNFTASFNGSSLGDVASGRYVPSMNCKMIQRYWEDKYYSWPGRAEQEAKAREEAAERRRQQEEARRQREAEAASKYEAEMKQYEADYAAWEKKKRQQEQLQNDALSRTMKQEKETAMKAWETDYDRQIKAIEEKKAQSTALLEETKQTLAGLGFFAFSAKQAAKRTIQNEEARLVLLAKGLDRIHNEFQLKEQDIQDQLSSKREKLKKDLERRYPVPTAPTKPRKPLSTSSYSSGGYISAISAANSAVQQAILDCMEPGRLYTITDIMENCPACADLTNQRVSALIRQLVPDQLERVEERRKAYFRLA